MAAMIYCDHCMDIGKKRPMLCGREGGLTFTEDILACAIPEAAAPDTHKDSWKAVTAGRKGRRFLMNLSREDFKLRESLALCTQQEKERQNQ